MPDSGSRTSSRPVAPPGPLEGATLAAVDVAVLDISGMVCAGCAARIRNNLLAWPGVLDADVDMARRTARVMFLRHRVLYRDFVDAVWSVGGDARVRFEATVIA